MGHKQHRVGRLHPRFLRLLAPGNGGTEGGVKTIEEGLGEKVELPLAKGRRRNSKKYSTVGRFPPALLRRESRGEGWSLR